jgi:phage tail-like protein
MKRSEIEQLLPGVFQRTVFRGTPVFALLEVMEALHSSAEGALLGLDAFFDPYRTPDRFVPMLASWVDLDRLLPEGVGASSSEAASFASGLGRLRELVLNASYLSQWRGTSAGLHRFLETATGVAGFTIDESVVDDEGRPKPFHMHVRVPPEAHQYRQLIHLIIDMEKPAYVTYDVHLDHVGDG